MATELRLLSLDRPMPQARKENIQMFNLKSQSDHVFAKRPIQTRAFGDVLVRP